ncbi:MAG: exopolyphosphatase [Flavobacterium sp.]
MIQVKKYAAIDIGSNAIRLLVSNVVEQAGKETQFSKSSLVRVPIRLGQDVFTVGEISEKNVARMIDAMKAYQLLMKVHGVEQYRACATSAMREAENKEEVVQTILHQSGIKIDIIDGKKEAEIIAATDLKKYIQLDRNYLYVDVGGGSTEFSIFSKGKIVASKSFRNGTVRQLNQMVSDAVWHEMERWIKQHTSEMEDICMIGSGGNINKLFKLSEKHQEKPLTYFYLNSKFQELNQLSYEERIAELGLNPDRADVIIPATKIYLHAMKWSGAKHIYVPKIGLSDGIIKAMYYERI